MYKRQEYRCHPPRGQAQAKEVVKGMHHGHDAQAGEEKDQRVAETQVVVDGPDEHDHQDQGEEEAGARRDDEDAPLEMCIRDRSKPSQYSVA